MDCKCCGNWFGSASDSEICSICERAVRRVGKYLSTIDPIRAAGGCRCVECRFEEDCEKQVTIVRRDYVLEQDIYKYCRIEWCGAGEPREAQDDD